MSQNILTQRGAEMERKRKLEEERKDVAQEIVRTNRALKVLNEEVEKMGESMSELEKIRVEAAFEKINELEDEVTGYKAKINVLEDEVTGYKAKINVLEDEVTGYKAKINVLEDEVTGYNAKNKQYKVKIENAEKEIANAEKEIANAEKEIANAEKEIAKAEKEIAKAENKIANVKGEITNAENKIASVNGEIARVKGEITNAENKIARVKGEIVNAGTSNLLNMLLLHGSHKEKLKELHQKESVLVTEIKETHAIAQLNSYRSGVNPLVDESVVTEGRFVKGKLKASHYAVKNIESNDLEPFLPNVHCDLPARYIPTSAMFDLCPGELGQGKHVYGGILGMEMSLSIEAPLQTRSELPTTIVFGVDEDKDENLMTATVVPDWAIAYNNDTQNLRTLAFVGEAKRGGTEDVGKACLLVHTVLCNMYVATCTTLDKTTPLYAYGVYVGGPSLTIIRATPKEDKTGKDLSKRENVNFVTKKFEMGEPGDAEKACELLVRIYAYVQEFWSMHSPAWQTVPEGAIEFTSTGTRTKKEEEEEKKKKKKEKKKKKKKEKKEEEEEKEGEDKMSEGTVEGVLAMCQANDDALSESGVTVDPPFVIHLVCSDARPEDALAEKNAERRVRAGWYRRTRVAIKELEHGGSGGGGEPRELTALKRLRDTRGVIDVCTTVRLPYLNRTALLTPLHVPLAGHWRLKEADGVCEWLAALFDQAAAALLAMCARGVAHGDVKPANMVVTARDELLFIDFGAATIGEPGGPLFTTSRAGTPGYIAPEKCVAAHKHDAVVADVFSLGASFRKLLAEIPVLKRTKTYLRLHDMLARMVADAPADRPTLAEVREWRQPRESSPTQCARSRMGVPARAVLQVAAVQ